MQLKARCLRSLLVAGWIALLSTITLAPRANAQVEASATTTVFREAGGPLDMTVINPAVNVRGTAGDRVVIHAGWEADVVSGASVAIVDAPASGVDVITTATQLDDFRNTATGSLTFLGEITQLRMSYTYGHESDYRSHGMEIAGRVELFERNTAFELSYARGWDRVCTLSQPRAQEAVDRQRLPSSDGCFSADDRESEQLSLQTFQGSWTQAWTPILASQLTLTSQILNGFQENPYRAVWLGRAAAREHHPENRARYAAGLGLRIWLRPLNGALQPFVRLYRDTWDIASITAELAYEQTSPKGVRFRVRGRYYQQRGAVFFSDDYVLEPAGQYFTGDRELSPMSSWVLGARVQWSVPPGEDGEVGFLSSLDLVGKFDYVLFSFDEFRYATASVPNDSALMATIGIEALF